MAQWGYGRLDGPDNWPKDFPQASGVRQSPINIITSNTQFDAELAEHKLNLAIDPVKSKIQTLSFTGHNFKVDTSTDSIVTTGIPGFKTDEYRLVQFHFHWGKDEGSEGSEHLINGKGWASELHLVHYNATKYAQFSDAVDKPDGLAVLGVFLEQGDSNEEFEILIKSLKNIQSTKNVNLNTNNSSLNLRNLLPNNTERYFTYPGSLTTPPCLESVTWVVFEQAISMSKEQLSEFRRVHDDDCKTSENYRPVCPLNNRIVKRSFK